ncbi:MAG TPA: hypothetical protein VMJ35_02230 [Dongiaceae bacterium]|nr:hypothetical protein [Dongiaceae bacterium]
MNCFASLRKLSLAVPAVLVCFFAAPSAVSAQGELQQRVAELKESVAKNKQSLATYTWKETDTVKLKGEVKKVSNFQVRTGPDGKPQKTPLDAPQQAQQQSGGGRGGRLKEHVVEKKKEEFKDYGEDMKSLAAQYLPPDKDKIQAAVAASKVSLTPEGSDVVKLIFKDYVKQGDAMTLTFNKTAKQLTSIAINSWMDDPKDAMNLTVDFSKLPDGTNYMSSTTIEGVAKQLTVVMQNSNYTKL